MNTNNDKPSFGAHNPPCLTLRLTKQYGVKPHLAEVVAQLARPQLNERAGQ